MNIIDAVFECSPLLKDAENWLKRVRSALSIMKENYLIGFPGKATA